jgi:hypothetical protein
MSEIAAREHEHLSPADALALLLPIAEKAPERYERTAARCVAVFLEAARSVTLVILNLRSRRYGRSGGIPGLP